MSFGVSKADEEDAQVVVLVGSQTDGLAGW